MTAAEWLNDVQDVVLSTCDCAWGALALDALEKSIASPADAALYAHARNEVEALAALCPVHEAALLPHL